MSTIHWIDSMQIIGSHVHAKLPQYISSKTFECGCHIFTHTNAIPSEELEFIHWCNALCGDIRNGSTNTETLYYKLLQEVDLI